MENDRRQILTKLSEGKITVTEAERLLDHLPQAPPSTSPFNPKSLRVIITPPDPSTKPTDVRIPLGLIRTGIRFGAFMPGNLQAQMQEEMRKRGVTIDLSKLDGDSIDRMSEALVRESIEVVDERGHIRIYCE